MSKKNLPKTEYPLLSTSVTRIPALDDYLNEGAVLLPELVRIRKKRAGGDEEEVHATEQTGPAQKRARKEYEQPDISLWSEEDRRILTNTDPELITKTQQLYSGLVSDFQNISQDYLTSVVENITSLMEQITGEYARQQLYKQLEFFQDIISAEPHSHLHMEPLPILTPEITIREIHPGFTASVRPSGWPDQDSNMMKMKYPEILRDLKELRHRIRYKKKITQARLSKGFEAQPYENVR